VQFDLLFWFIQFIHLIVLVTWNLSKSKYPIASRVSVKKEEGARKIKRSKKSKVSTMISPPPSPLLSSLSRIISPPLRLHTSRLILVTHVPRGDG
jgi:hypothetical protein